jgi:hypothetical protein
LIKEGRTIMDASHPAYLALEGHKPEVYWLDYDECEVNCSCGDGGTNYNLHALDVLDQAHLLMDTRRPYSGPIPNRTPNTLQIQVTKTEDGYAITKHVDIPKTPVEVKMKYARTDWGNPTR